MAATKQFGGSVYAVAETSYGVAVSNPTYLRFGNLIREVKVGLKTNKQAMRSIDSPSVSDFLLTLKRPTVSITYVLQRGSPLTNMVARTNDAVSSFNIEVGVDANTSTNDAYYTFLGCKATDITFKASMDDYVEVTVDFVCASVTVATAQPSVGSGSRESALDTGTSPYCQFAIASVTRDAATWDAGCTGIEFTISHNIEVMGALGSSTGTLAPEGPIDIEGTATVYFEAGGKTYHDLVGSDSSSTIILNCGASGAPKLTLSGCEFDTFEMTLNNTDALVMGPIPFKAKTVALGTV